MTYKVWIVTFFSHFDELDVKITYSPEEAEAEIYKYFGEMLLNISNAEGVKNVEDFFKDISVVRDEKTGIITSVCWGYISDDIREEYIDVTEKEFKLPFITTT
jgi:hypothetical protein